MRILELFCLFCFFIAGVDCGNGNDGKEQQDEPGDSYTELTCDAVPFTSEKQPEPVACILDLANPDLFVVQQTGYENNRFAFREYLPRDGFKVVSVMYNSQVLWTSGEMKFRYLDWYSKDGENIVVISYHRGHLMYSDFFEFVRGAWYPRNALAFSNKICKMMSPRDNPPLEVTREMPGDVHASMGAVNVQYGMGSDLYRDLQSEHSIEGHSRHSIETHSGMGVPGPSQEYMSEPHQSILGASYAPWESTAHLNVIPHSAPLDTSPFTPAILNISHLDTVIYASFDYIFYRMPIRLVVPREDIRVVELVDTPYTIWCPSKDERFGYARLYLDENGKPRVVQLILRVHNDTVKRYFRLRDGIWEESRSCHDAHIAKLALPGVRATFDLNIDSDSDSPACRIFEVNLLGVTTRHFYPKPGYHAIEVIGNRRIIWKAMQNPGEEHIDHCISCIIHKKGNVQLLELTIAEKTTRNYRHFKLVPGGWKGVTLKEFFDRLDVLCN